MRGELANRHRLLAEISVFAGFAGDHGDSECNRLFSTPTISTYERIFTVLVLTRCESKDFDCTGAFLA